MRFLTLEDCSDSELHCIYHDPERTVTLLHPRTACSLHLYAPQEDTHTSLPTYHTRRPNTTHAWWLQLSGITTSRLLGTTSSLTQTPPPTVDKALTKWHLTNIRPIIPTHDVLDEDEHLQSLQPLPSPWSWPDNTFYREARRGCAQHLTESLIADLVTRGLLLVNDTGIRWKHLDQYVLVKIEDEGAAEGVAESEGKVFNRANRPRFEKLDPRAFRQERIRRPGLNGEWNGGPEKPATPIEQIGDPLVAPGEKRVRICGTKRCVGDGVGMVEEEDVEDNEGKTVGRAREVEREVERRRGRGRMVWDSQRRS